MGTNSGCGCTKGGTPYSGANRINGGARKKRGTGKKHGTKKAKRGGGIISTAAAPVALYGLARMAHRGKRHSKKRTQRRRRTMRGGTNDPYGRATTMKEAIEAANKAAKERGEKWNNKTGKYVKQNGGSVLGNALPSLVLYGLARGMRGTKKNSNHNGNKTRKMRRRSRRGRRM